MRWRGERGKPFMAVRGELTGGVQVPVFSESYLYETVGKDDARFILAIAEEYAALIEVLGPEAIQLLLSKHD